MTKYNAKKITIDGHTFDSLAEGRRYSELKILESVGIISTLMIHPVYPIDVNNKRIGKYIADFVYWQDGKEIIEDVKGVKTAVYRLKKRLVEAIYGIEITET